MLQSLDHDACKHQFLEAAQNYLEHQSLFSTADGYMGRGPPYAEPSDQICVLLGCKVPVVTRPKDEYVQVVGLAFIPGMMDGEMMAKVAAGRFEKQSFRFR